METSKTGNKHQGRQVKRFRESIGMKQEVLAEALKTSQQNISYYEKQESLDDELFSRLASSMGVSPEILSTLTMESPILNIGDMKDSAQAFNYVHNFNPIDKILDQANKIEELYKDLLQSERDKVALLTETIKSLQELISNNKK